MKILFGLLMLLTFANATSTLVKLTRTERRMRLLEKLLDKRGLMRCIFYHDLRQEPDRDCLLKYHISKHSQHFVSILSSIVIDVVFQRHTCISNNKIPELKNCIKIVKFDFRHKFHLYVRTVEERTIFLEIVNKFIRYFTYIKMRKENVLHLDADQALSFRQPPALEGKMTSDAELSPQIVEEPEHEPVVQSEPENQDQPTDSTDMSSQLNGLADKLHALKEKIISTLGGQQTNEPVVNPEPTRAAPGWLKNLVQAYKDDGTDNNQEQANADSGDRNKSQEPSNLPFVLQSFGADKQPCDQVAEKIAGLPEGAQQLQVDQTPVINIYPVTKEEQKDGETVSSIQPMIIVIAPLDAIKKIQPQLEQEELALEKQQKADEELRKKTAEELQNQAQVKKTIADNLAAIRRREPVKENENSFNRLRIIPKAQQEKPSGSSKVTQKEQPTGSSKIAQKEQPSGSSKSAQQPSQSKEQLSGSSKKALPGKYSGPESSSDAHNQSQNDLVPTKNPFKTEQELKIQPIKSTATQEPSSVAKKDQQKQKDSSDLLQELKKLNMAQKGNAKTTLPSEPQTIQQAGQTMNQLPSSSLSFTKTKHIHIPIIEKRRYHGNRSKFLVKPKTLNGTKDVDDDTSFKGKEQQNENPLKEALEKKHQQERQEELNQSQREKFQGMLTKDVGDDTSFKRKEPQNNNPLKEALEKKHQKEQLEELNESLRKKFQDMLAEKMREQKADEQGSEVNLSNAKTIPDNIEANKNTQNEQDLDNKPKIQGTPKLFNLEEILKNKNLGELKKDEDGSAEDLPSKIEVDNIKGESVALARKAKKIIPSPVVNNIVLKGGKGKDNSDADDGPEEKTATDNGEKNQSKTTSQGTSTQVTEQVIKETKSNETQPLKETEASKKQAILTKERAESQSKKEQSELAKKETREEATEANLDPSQNRVKVVATEVKDISNQAQVAAQTKGDTKEAKTTGQQAVTTGDKGDKKEAPKAGDDKNKKEAAKGEEKKDPCHANVFSIVALLILSIVWI